MYAKTSCYIGYFVSHLESQTMFLKLNLEFLFNCSLMSGK